ncbi:MAG: BLUF domain-containing protein [Sphingomonas bacterium]|nr:BLUF domain-containing protein [Sphingomonas bacterium]
MLRLLYISTSRAPIRQPLLESILATSHRNNSKVGITGLLIAGGTRFLQALEGEPDALDATADRIRNDDRHFAMTVLSKTEITQRAFPQWSMGYQMGGDVAVGTTLSEAVTALTAPIADATLRAYFTGFAELHAAA